LELELTHRMVVREAMSSPAITVGEGEVVREVARVMDENKIGAVIVLDQESRPVGIVTERDILRIVPTIIEIIRERSRILGEAGPSSPSLTGICERCGAYSMNLKEVDGMYLCEDCIADEEA